VVGIRRDRSCIVGGEMGARRRRKEGSTVVGVT
jgi:hypothetical protein